MARKNLAYHKRAPTLFELISRARLNSLSAPGQSQSNHNFTLASEVCASANPSSMASAFSAAARAFGQVSSGERMLKSPKTVYASARPA